MAYIPDQQKNTGSFIPTTNVWDPSEMMSTDVNSPQFKELIVRLYQNVNNVAMVLNNKTSGYYLNEEFVTSNLYPPLVGLSQLELRPEFRKLITYDALNAGANPQNHDLDVDADYKFTGAFGMANDPVGFNYYPLPWASAAGATNIEVAVTATQVIVTNNSGIVFGESYIVLSYLKI